MTDIDSEILAMLYDHGPRALDAARRTLATDVAAELAKVAGDNSDQSHHNPTQSQIIAALTRTLVKAGFTLHDCTARARTGGVCLTPASRNAGVLITWTTHDALALDGYHVEDSDIHEVMNYALADVLRTCGWQVDAFGDAGAHIVRGRIVPPEAASQS